MFKKIDKLLDSCHQSTQLILYIFIMSLTLIAIMPIMCDFIQVGITELYFMISVIIALMIVACVIALLNGLLSRNQLINGQYAYKGNKIRLLVDVSRNFQRDNIAYIYTLPSRKEDHYVISFRILDSFVNEETLELKNVSETYFVKALPHEFELV